MPSQSAKQFISYNEPGYINLYKKLNDDCSASRFRLEVIAYLFQQKFPLPVSLIDVSIHVLSELTYLIRFHQATLSFLAKNDRDGTHKKDITPHLIRTRQENERAVSIIINLFSNKKDVFNYDRICEAREKVKAEREGHHLTFNLFAAKPQHHAVPKRSNTLPSL